MSDDRPVSGSSRQTPLMEAETPHLNRMVRDGIGGWSLNTPKGYYPGSDVANLGVLGYDITQCYTGRSPLEAAAMGVQLDEKDVAFRCNLVALSQDFRILKDFSADHISTEDSEPLIRHLNAELGNAQFQFYPGVGYRHLLVWRGGYDAMQCVPPHDIADQAILDYLPKEPGAKPIVALMKASWEILSDHPVNRARMALGKRSANSIWLWGQGRRPAMARFQKLYHKSGGLITAVDLMRGIALNIGFEILPVSGATGWIDTNYAGKAQVCIEALQRHDLIFLHVESPDEAGHVGRRDYKIQAIEDFDAQVVGPVLKALEDQWRPFRTLALPDHPTPVASRTHTSDPVPVALFGTDITPDNNTLYDERLLETASLTFDPGHLMMRHFLE